MQSQGGPDASLIIANLRIEANAQGSHYAVIGSGILKPGMVIPNEWWDRAWMVNEMVVSHPVATADGLLMVDFRGRVELADGAAMGALITTGTRDLVEREIVPAVLLGLGMAKVPTKGFRPNGMDIRDVMADNIVKEVLEEIDRDTLGHARDLASHVGMPVDMPYEPPRARASVIHDLVRMSVGQPTRADKDTVMLEAARHGLMASGHFAHLLTQAVAGVTQEPATAPGPEPVRRKSRARVRVVDT